MIADLQVQADELQASTQAATNLVTNQVADIVASYEALIVNAKTASEAISAPLLAEAAAIDAQIVELTEAAAEGWETQVADLTSQRDTLLTNAETEESALQGTIAGLQADQDAAIIELKSTAEPVDGTANQGMIDDIDAQIADHNAEIETLRAGADSTAVLITNVATSTDILASIEATENHWNGLITDIDGKIQSLKAELESASAVDSQLDSRIRSLQLQAAELESNLNTQIANLEATVNELYRQADGASSGDSVRLAEVQTQIDALNDKLEAIWQRDSSNGLDLLKNVQTLEAQARAMEEKLEQQTRTLEEALWVIDDMLNQAYQDQENDNKILQVEFEGQMAEFQQRRSELDAQRWVIEEEQRATFDAIEVKMKTEEETIRRTQQQEFDRIRGQIRDLERELKVFRDRQRDLEIEMNETRQLVDQKKRELEDKVFDALDAAAGAEGMPMGVDMDLDPPPEMNDGMLLGIDEGNESPVGTGN